MSPPHLGSLSQCVPEVHDQIVSSRLRREIDPKAPEIHSLRSSECGYAQVWAFHELWGPVRGKVRSGLVISIGYEIPGRPGKGGDLRGLSPRGSRAFLTLIQPLRCIRSVRPGQGIASTSAMWSRCLSCRTCSLRSGPPVYRNLTCQRDSFEKAPETRSERRSALG